MRRRRSSFHFAFGLEFAVLEDQSLHPVRFHLEGELNAVGGQVLEVRRKVLTRECIVDSAVLADQSGEGPLRVLGGALEHHMLKHVREAGASHHFVA